MSYNFSKIINEKLTEKDKENEDKIKTVSNKSKTIDEVLDDLKDIASEYKYGDYTSAPESLNLSKKEVEEKSDSELENLARSTLDKKYSEKKQTTSDSFRKQIEDTFAQAEEAKKNTSKMQEEVNSLYDSSIKDTENQALRRGLARSSIVINQLSNINESRAKELSGILQNLESTLSNSQSKIQQLETEKEKALSDLDISYALELEQEIQNEKEEYLKRRNEAIEFNNNVDKLEAEYKLKHDKEVTDLQKERAELEDKYGLDYVNEQIRNKQYEYLQNYFSNLDKDFALEILARNKDLKVILGINYNRLVDYIKNR